jgi:phenylacetyl-CoA:acceptor oxidoreductase 26-kDa subunit
MSPPVMGLGLLAVAASALLWRRYHASAKANGIPPLSRAVLDRMSPRLQAVGQLAPALLVLLALLLPSVRPLALAVAGLTAAAGGAYWKFTLIARAGFFQGYSLKKMPQRGSGQLAAPARLAGVAHTVATELRRGVKV